jgi:hypothetical protein
LAVLLSWIWDSYWPNGRPLSELEEEEVNERFQDWAKIIQRQRAAEVFDVELDADDLDAMGDFGTTFNVFAGWFMMLVEYLLTVRRAPLCAFLAVHPKHARLIESDPLPIVRDVDVRHGG